MIFNSLNFALFLPIVFGLYWFGSKGNLKLQNLLLLISSYFFYACWDWRFMFLLVFSTILDFFTGKKIYLSENKRSKLNWLLISIIINLGFLGVFKYYNFFISSFADALSVVGLNVNYFSIQVILPVGISFYTFHGLSYVFDIYKNKIIPEKNFINYSVFVSFFPLLVAGPIERATHLLPQITKKRHFDYSKAVDGMRQILWGLFKKIVIADNCATYVNTIFENYTDYSGSSLLLGAFFFTFQIYCDFSGYSDIALGTARLFGIELLKNFAFPYFSRDIAEFWRRWHISLSSWFKDYLYIPLGGSKGNMWSRIRNTFIIFLVSGFWHGANWTYICWGLLNAIYILPSIIFKTNRKNLEIAAKGKLFPNFHEISAIFITFCLTILAWIFFRSATVIDALSFIKSIFNSSSFTPPDFPGFNLSLKLIFIIIVFQIIEWLGREQNYAIAGIANYANRTLRWMVYISIIFVILIFSGVNQEFIYFQF